MAPVTDLQYSKAGDRILTASQKDGNARIWYWPSTMRCQANLSKEGLKACLREPKQIILRLNQASRKGSNGSSRRRRGNNRGNANNGGKSTVTCDVAVWTSDDSKVVTSQSCPKNNSEDILPGSQLLLIWESWTGDCLLAINQAHSMQCAVLISHPKDPSILCTAGLDGLAKVWDLETGDGLFSYENKIEYGPVANKKERGDPSGYLDGAFDPDGTILVLTDDNGRISIFDSLQSPLGSQKQEIQAWHREQYFGNDYYELFYNTDGYCVERGSEQPPHLAPRSARCNHAGAPWSEEVSDVYQALKGPAPLSEEAARDLRNSVRRNTLIPSNTSMAISRDKRRGIIMAEFDAKRTVQINFTPGGPNVDTPTVPASHSITANGARPLQNDQLRQLSVAGRNLSSNYRWRDYEDMIQHENMDDDADADDEDFVIGRRDSSRRQDDEDLSDGFVSDELGEDGDDERRRRSYRRNRNTNERALRVQRRETDRQEREERREVQVNAASMRSSRRQREARQREEAEEENSDEDVMEYMSSNNTPSGAYLHDCGDDGHFFRLPNVNAKVERLWVRRLESSSPYHGTKIYAPQVGDSVVYIPKAHYNVVQEYPTLGAPWQHWPEGTQWPIVRCRVLNIRYRFPYKNYYKGRRSSE